MESKQKIGLLVKDVPEAVKSTLALCQAQLEIAERDGPWQLARDLRVAVRALDGINREITGEIPQRPRGLRSAEFIRYVIDEGEVIVLDPSLVDRITDIEHLYKRL